MSFQNNNAADAYQDFMLPTALDSDFSSEDLADDSKIEVTLELKNGTKLVDSWSDSGTNYVMLSGSHKVVSGQTYTLVASGTINGRTFNTSVSGTCP